MVINLETFLCPENPKDVIDDILDARYQVREMRFFAGRFRLSRIAMTATVFKAKQELQ